jgi:imidazolonepropionase-like amidohydrolase
MNRRTLLGGSVAVVASLARTGRANGDNTIAITNARIHSGDGTRIDAGTVVFQGDTIAAIGPTSLPIPDGAQVVDGRGLWLTPGLVDAESLVGLVDIFGERATRESAMDERRDPIRAAFSVLDGWNPRSVVIPVTRIEGVTSVGLAPREGLVSGRGAVVRLTGDRADKSALKAPSAIYISLAHDGRHAGFDSRGGALLALRELFDDVRQFAKRRNEFERNEMRALSASRLDLDALIPVVEGKLPVVIEAHRASDIESTLSFIAEQHVSAVLSGCEEGWLVKDAIALSAHAENAARLHSAGVEVILATREMGDHESRTLRFQAGNAVANGLPWEAALSAVTARPARILGVADRIGTLGVGKLADCVLWSGDPFEPLTRPRHIFMGGVEIPRVSRQTMLRDRYRAPKTLRR